MMFVDDLRLAHDLLVSVLDRREHAVLFGTTEEEIRRLLESHAIDVVLMRLDASDASGQELLWKLCGMDDAVPRVVVIGEKVPLPVGGVRVDFVDPGSFRLESLLRILEEECDRPNDPREEFRVRTSHHDVWAEVSGQGPYRVVNMSSRGLCVLADICPEEGEVVPVVLRTDLGRTEGQMEVRNVTTADAGLTRCGMRLVPGSGSLEDGLHAYTMHVQREIVRIRSARAAA